MYKNIKNYFCKVGNSNESLQVKEKQQQNIPKNSPTENFERINRTFNERAKSNNEKETSNSKKPRIIEKNIPVTQTANQKLSNLYGRKFSLSNLKNMRPDEIFSHKKIRDQLSENKFGNVQKNRSFKEEIFLGYCSYKFI